MKTEITWDDFEQVELRSGTVVDVQPFPEARKPAYKVWVDLGEAGVKKSSARITELYEPEDLLGTQVICVTNFPPRQIGPFLSEVLITGFYTDEGVVLAQPERKIPNGKKLG